MGKKLGAKSTAAKRKIIAEISQLKHIIGAMLILIGIGIVLFYSSGRTIIHPEPDLSGRMDTLVIQPQVQKFAGLSLQDYDTTRIQIKRNSVLSSLLEEYGVPYSTVAQLAALPDSVFNERRLNTRDMLLLVLAKGSAEKQVKGLIYSKDKEHYSKIFFGDFLSYECSAFPTHYVRKELAGEIKSSLYQTIVNMGGSRDLVVKLEEVYAWSLDFYHIRKGDYLKVIYRERWINEEFRGVEAIDGALFHHSGENLYAFGFNQGSGLEYFDNEGKSLQKAFLKAPLKYSRISSKFSYSRFHPVLKVRRPHLGVDYAAPIGTPIYAVGDGEITKKGYRRGNGNYLKIKHNGSYETMYLHLSKFGKGIYQGARVKQGQLIAYVGSTGYSTGPHLDYRIFRNGVAVDPLKIKLPPSHPVKSDLAMAFDSVKNDLKADLQLLLMP